MRSLPVHVLALAALLVTTARAETQTFETPELAGYRVDICRVWGNECGQPAGDEFCRRQGFERADMSTVEHDIGAVTPTRTLGDGKVCDQNFCDGFRAITCVRPGAGARSSTNPPAAGQPPPGWSAPVLVFVDPPWTPKDVIRANIDVQAQYALFRMLKRPAPAWRSAASTLLSAVHAGAIKGIYQEDQQVPALRAQQVGKWWKQIIPGYAGATCMKEPAGQPPVIVVRKGTPASHEEYDAWLTLAWEECGIAGSWPLHSYDPSAPGDPPETGTMRQCKGAEGMAEALQLCQDLHRRSVARCKKRYLLQASGNQSLADQFEGAGGLPGCEDSLAAKHAACQQDARAMCQ